MTAHTEMWQTSSQMDSGRRYLLTGVVRHYQNDSSLNREELDKDEDRIIRFFRGFGYEHVPVIGDSPTRDTLATALRDFCRHPDRRPDDYLVVYLAAHGEILDGGPALHVLLTADFKPEDVRTGSVKAAELAEWMLAETRVHRLLLIIDACMSGQGALDFTKAAGEYPGDKTGLDPGWKQGVMAITATRPNELAHQGVFTECMLRAERRLIRERGSRAGLQISDIFAAVHEDPKKPPFQHVTTGVIRSSAAMPGFLDDSEQPRAPSGPASTGQRVRRTHEMRERFASHVGEFIGRGRARQEIVDWLENPANSETLILSSEPGSGKTALLGRLASASDRRYMSTVPRDSHADPRPGTIDVAIYAEKLTGNHILAGIAEAALVRGVDPEAPYEDTVAVLLRGLAGREHPLTVLIDAIDEAFAPESIVTDVLCPLIDGGTGSIRFLLGARRQVLEYFASRQTVYRKLDLDDTFADPHSLIELVRGRLMTPWRSHSGEPRESVFATAPLDLVEEVASKIANVADHNFLLADPSPIQSGPGGTTRPRRSRLARQPSARRWVGNAPGLGTPGSKSRPTVLWGCCSPSRMRRAEAFRGKASGPRWPTRSLREWGMATKT